MRQSGPEKQVGPRGMCDILLTVIINIIFNGMWKLREWLKRKTFGV
jgi:hypothetical protein